MPLDEGKLKQLYGTLQEGGYSQDYDTFKKGFTGNEHYENRKKVYDLLTENGAQIGSTYEEFMQKMQKPRVQPSVGNADTGAAQSHGAVNSAPTDGDVGAKPTTEPSVKKSSSAAPHGTPLTEQDRIRMGAAAWQLGQNAVKGVKGTNARLGRMVDSVTLKGKKRERLGDFRARVSGTPTTVAGAPTVSLTGNGVAAGNVQAPKEGGTKSAESPKPYGVVYENGKAKTQWLMPDGSLTTSLLDANNAEYAARTERLARAFHDRMRENGLDPENADDVKKQSQLDYEAPLREAVEAAWQRAEADDRKAGEQYRKDYEKSRHGGFLDMAKEALTTAFDAGGQPLQRSSDYQRDLGYNIQRRETFDLGKMAESVYRNIPQSYRESQILAYADYFRKHPQELKGRSVPQAADDALRGEAYRATYERAVKANMPKSKTEFFLRKVADQPFLSQSMATDMAASALTGSYGMSEAEADAMGRYGKEHRVLDIAGTVANMAVDPVTYVSGGVGGILGKKALQVAGKAMLKGATKDVAARYAGRTLAGRLVAGAAGAAGNFGTFETLKDIEGQMRMGGVVDPETGERGLSGSDVLKSTLRGTLLGSVTGAMSPLIGNVADKLVKSSSSVAGKAGVRVGEVAASTVAEGTVFATPEWIENAGLADDDPNKRSAMDVWTDNMAMMLGFKASHAVKSAPRVIAGLRPIAEPKTMQEREHNRRSFMELLRERLDVSPSDMDFTPDERRELEGRGYGDLAGLFRRETEGDAGVKTPAHKDSEASDRRGSVEDLEGL